MSKMLERFPRGFRTEIYYASIAVAIVGAYGYIQKGSKAEVKFHE